jgi:hypothetical protein
VTGKKQERIVTMMDEIFDRHYQEGRAELNAGINAAISRLRKAVGNAFNVLQRIEYDAPWTANAKRARCN